MEENLKVSEEPNKEIKEARTQEILDYWQKINGYMNSIFASILKNRDNFSIEIDSIIRDDLRKAYRDLRYAEGDIRHAIEKGYVSKSTLNFVTVWENEMWK